MGAWLSSILQGAGRTGGDIQEAKNANTDLAMQKSKQQLAQLQSQMELQRLQQEMKAAGINEQLNKAPQVVHSYKGADGKLHNVVRDPMSGALADQVGGDEAPSGGSIEEKVADFTKANKRAPNEREMAALSGTTPKAPPSPKYSGEKIVRDLNSPTKYSYEMVNEVDPTQVVKIPGA